MPVPPPGDVPDEGVTIDGIVAWLEETLDPTRVSDYGPNGLQVAGPRLARRVATGVTANLAFIDAAGAWGADLLVVHHGIFWDGAPMRLTGALGRRVRALVEGRMALAAWHLPLDSHPTLGNAHGLARAVGLVDATAHFPHRGLPVGCIGRLPSAEDAADVVARIRAAVGADVLWFPGGPAHVERVGIVTGGAARDVARAIEEDCDLYLTGEAGEYSQATAHEEGIHFVAAGHHRTERFGPQALAAAISAQWPGVQTQFIDVDNPA